MGKTHHTGKTALPAQIGRAARACAFGLLLTLPLSPQAQSLFIHAEQAAPSLSLNQARNIFSMRAQSWPDGSSITVFVLPDEHPQHGQFVRQVLSLVPYQLRRTWDRLTYTGIGDAPVEVKTEEEMLERLANTPGSIGYLREELANAAVQKITLY